MGNHTGGSAWFTEKAAFFLFVDSQVYCVPSRDTGAGDTWELVAYVYAL